MRFPLRIELHSSRRMICLSAAIHLVAALAFVRSVFPVVVVIVALVLLAWSWRATQQAEAAKGFVALVLDEHGGLRLETLDGEIQARALGSSTDFGWAVWLQWESMGRARRRGALMLLGDNLSPHAQRGLRIWLRHKALALREPAP